MDTQTYREIQNVYRMSVRELRDKYLDVFGEETRAYNKDFLRKRIAWRIQAVAEGDLTERARRRAAQIANDSDLRVRAPRDPVVSGSAEVRARSVVGHITSYRDPRLPLPGTLLEREYKGRDIIVKVLDQGFEFDGKKFKSLTAIARQVTGSKWNGFSFFGIARAPLMKSKEKNEVIS